MCADDTANPAVLGRGLPAGPPPPEKAQPPACPPCERKQARMLETYRACNLPLALLDLC